MKNKKETEWQRVKIHKDSFPLLNKNEIKQKLLLTGFFNDNEDLDKYLEIIIKNQNLKEEYIWITECHHIVPVCVSKFLKQPVDNSSYNLVNLSAKDHALAHYYLCKCTINLRLFQRLCKAVIMLFSVTKNWLYNDLTNEEYKKIKLELVNECAEELQQLMEIKYNLKKAEEYKWYCRINEELKKNKTFV